MAGIGIERCPRLLHGVLGPRHDNIHIPPRLEDPDACRGGNVCTVEWFHPMRLGIGLLVYVDGHECVLHAKEVAHGQNLG